MSELHCHYHKDRIAHDKCEKCGKLLCLECKISGRTYHDNGDPAGSGYYTHYILCPDCNIEKNETQSSYNIVICIITILFFLAIQIGLMASAKERYNIFDPGVPKYTPGLIALVSGVIIIFGGLITVIFYMLSKENTTELKEKHQKMLEQINIEKKDGTTALESSSDLNELSGKYCPECGTSLGGNYTVCEHCGASIIKSKEE